MSLKSLSKAVGRALPVILANAPAVVAAFKAVKRAARDKGAQPAAHGGSEPPGG